MDECFETFQQVYDEQFQTKYGFWRPVVERSVAAFLKCGDLEEGYQREHDMLIRISLQHGLTPGRAHVLDQFGVVFQKLFGKLRFVFCSPIDLVVMVFVVSQRCVDPVVA